MGEQLSTTAGQAMYLFAPLLGTAALSGVVLRRGWWPGLARPIDLGLTFRQRRLFGDNKTWRGLVCSVLGCTAVVAVQKYLLGDRAGRLAVIEYENVGVVALGAALGFGAMLGELPNSFLKRRLGVAPGDRPHGPLRTFFYFADQVDPLLFAWPLLRFWVRPTWPLVLASVVVVFAIHQVVSLAGYAIGARSSWS